MDNSSEYYLVPGYDSDGSLNGYYTREPDGVSGMTVTALADFCGVEQPVVTNLLNKIRDSDPILNDLSESLEPFAGKDLRLISNDPIGRRVIPDDCCEAVAEYYAFDARDYKGRAIAQRNYRAVAKAGIRLFIWSKTGFRPPHAGAPSSSGSYWYKRLSKAMSDTEKPLQSGYFCVYLEMMRFFSELESRFQYVISDIDLETGKHLVPDIAIAQRFNKWLREDDEIACMTRKEFLGSTSPIDFRPERKLKNGLAPAGANHHEIEVYNHIYPSDSHGQYCVQQANSYPNKYKSIFHHYLEDYWVPDFCVEYLSARDPKGLNSIRESFALMPERTQKAIAKTLVGKLVYSLPASINK